jgi:hypothetical protein
VRRTGRPASPTYTTSKWTYSTSRDNPFGKVAR